MKHILITAAVLVAAYIVGARYPALAQKLGAA